MIYPGQGHSLSLRWFTNALETEQGPAMILPSWSLQLLYGFHPFSGIDHILLMNLSALKANPWKAENLSAVVLLAKIR